jgi:uncharacterized protein
MDITPLIRRDAQVIGAYGAGHIKVSGVVYHQPVLITPSATRPWDGTHQSLLLSSDQFEILLLGTGDTIVPVSSEVRAAFREKGVGLEVMDTGAVARTYNVLLAEGRRVAAAVILNSG